MLELFIFCSLNIEFSQNINNSSRKLLIPFIWSSKAIEPEPVLVKSVGSKVPLKNTVFKLSSTPAAIKCLSCTVMYSTDFVPVTVISPAKKLNFNADSPIKAFSQCDFLDESKKLVDEAKDYSFDDIMKLMRVSENIANLTVQRFQEWKLPFDDQNAKQAALAFNGDTYAGLEADTFSKDDFDYSQNHLRILSGLYGLLRPLDLIQAYRLEMGTKIENKSGKNLYEFWGDMLASDLEKDLAGHESKYLVNCASVEYFKSIDKDTLKGKVVTPVFKEVKNGKARIVSFFAKKARGMMARYIIQNQINNPDEIKQFDLGGYEYSDELSNTMEPVFIRAQA